MFCMSLFDVTGIQDFIFSSKKAKENIGASALVEKVFKEFLVKEICSAFPGACTDWEKAKEFRMLSDSPPSAEVIYIGGGNALVAFQDRGSAVETTKHFSHRVLKETGGTLNVAVAHLDTEGQEFSKDMEKLQRKLERRKFNLPHSEPLRGLAVTREGVSDGLPACESDGDKDEEGYWISAPACLKRKAALSEQRAATDDQGLFARLVPKGFCFPAEFDGLGRNKDTGESLLAVVHIDGNNMGAVIKEAIKDKEYKEAVASVRKVSGGIARTYKNVFQKIVFSLAEALCKNKEFRDIFGFDEKNKNKYPLPLRPLIFAGDDVTFVCDGRIALAMTADFLKVLSEEIPLFSKNGEKRFTACAGIAVVKPHFPFHRAYTIAEDLCASAKRRAKVLAEANEVGSWLDFEIVYSGMPLDLHEYRARKYNFPDQEALASIKSGERHHLLWRPYFVAGPESSNAYQYRWSDAIECLKRITGADEAGKEWPRSKLKGLKEALAISKGEAIAFYEECASRGNKFCERGNELFEGSRTKWFDVLDMLDVYVEIPPSGEEAKDVED